MRLNDRNCSGVPRIGTNAAGGTKSKTSGPYWTHMKTMTGFSSRVSERLPSPHAPHFSNRIPSFTNGFSGARAMTSIERGGFRSNTFTTIGCANRFLGKRRRRRRFLNCRNGVPQPSGSKNAPHSSALRLFEGFHFFSTARFTGNSDGIRNPYPSNTCPNSSHIPQKACTTKSLLCSGRSISPRTPPFLTSVAGTAPC